MNWRHSCTACGQKSDAPHSALTRLGRRLGTSHTDPAGLMAYTANQLPPLKINKNQTLCMSFLTLGWSGTTVGVLLAIESRKVFRYVNVLPWSALTITELFLLHFLELMLQHLLRSTYSTTFKGGIQGLRVYCIWRLAVLL